MTMTPPHANGQAGAQPPAAMLMLLQVALLPDGNVAINVPPGVDVTSAQGVALAHFTLAKALAKLQTAQFVPQSGVEMAPPGTQVARNPRA